MAIESSVIVLLLGINNNSIFSISVPVMSYTCCLSKPDSDRKVKCGTVLCYENITAFWHFGIESGYHYIILIQNAAEKLAIIKQH
jgi:hypothetical protein